jgi:tRNA-(ms[2]io[6]A)-hydroxylase
MGLQNFGLYWMLAEKGFGREATVARLQALAAAEVAALQGVLAGPQEVRFHSFGVQNR